MGTGEGGTRGRTEPGGWGPARGIRPITHLALSRMNGKKSVYNGSVIFDAARIERFWR
ncbi:MAG: hypothetical protein Kow0092_30340 [Deferrisomatales bacterium]